MVRGSRGSRDSGLARRELGVHTGSAGEAGYCSVVVLFPGEWKILAKLKEANGHCWEFL